MRALLWSTLRGCLTCRIVATDGTAIPFAIDPDRRHALLEGLDQLGETLLSLADIVAFQEQDRVKRPWIWDSVSGSKK